MDNTLRDNYYFDVLISKYKFYFIGILISLFSLYGYIFNSYINFSFLLLILILLSFNYFFKNKKVLINKNIFVYITLSFSLLFFLSISLFYTNYKLNNLNSLIFKSVIFFIGILLVFENRWQIKIINTIYCFSLIHVVLTMISFLFTDFFERKFIIFFPINVINAFHHYSVRNSFSGITNQIGTNGFFLSLVAVIASIYFITNKKSKLNIFILFVSIIALLLNNKRTDILVVVIPFTILFILYNIKNKKSIFMKIIILMMFVVLLVSILILFNPELEENLERFIPNEDKDFTSGRISLYIEAFNMIKEKPFFGWGGNTFGNLNDISVHNGYIQIIAENGLITFVLFVLFLMYNLIFSLKFYLLQKLNNSEERIALFSLFIQLLFMLRNLPTSSFYYNFVFIIYIMSISMIYSLFNENIYKRKLYVKS